MASGIQGRVFIIHYFAAYVAGGPRPLRIGVLGRIMQEFAAAARHRRTACLRQDASDANRQTCGCAPTCPAQTQTRKKEKRRFRGRVGATASHHASQPNTLRPPPGGGTSCVGGKRGEPPTSGRLWRVTQDHHRASNKSPSAYGRSPRLLGHEPPLLTTGGILGTRKCWERLAHFGGG